MKFRLLEDMYDPMQPLCILNLTTGWMMWLPTPPMEPELIEDDKRFGKTTPEIIKGFCLEAKRNGNSNLSPSVYNALLDFSEPEEAIAYIAKQQVKHDKWGYNLR